MRALEVVDKTLLKGRDSIALPLVGRVSAGPPSLAAEDIEEHVEIPRSFLGDVRDCFLLRVKGDSMIGVGIMPGDIVIVRRQPTASPGEIVVALLDEDATVKTLGTSEGKPALLPANPAYQPLPAPFRIIGRVIGLLRAYEGVYEWS